MPASPSTPSLAIVMPVYNDWAALSALVSKIDAALAGLEARARLVIVDDGSLHGQAWSGLGDRHASIDGIEMLELEHNHGHQFAIAVGLAHAVANLEFDALVVMDADGEDDPANLGLLLAAHREAPESIIFAARGQRHEGLPFRLGYAVYRAVFRLLTGRAIRFGNFSLLPRRLAQRVARIPGIFSHYAASLVRSGLPLTTVTADRGHRLAGQSRMNYISLVRHGMGSIYQFVDLVACRLLLVAAAILVASAVGFLGIIAVRLFTDLAIPGWSSTVLLGLVLVFIQSLTLALILVFASFGRSTQLPLVPADHYMQFLAAPTAKVERRD